MESCNCSRHLNLANLATGLIDATQAKLLATAICASLYGQHLMSSLELLHKMKIKFTKCIQFEVQGRSKSAFAFSPLQHPSFLSNSLQCNRSFLCYCSLDMDIHHD